MDSPNQPELEPIEAAKPSAQENIQKALEKFRELPKNMQMGIIGGVAVVLLLIVSGGDEPQQQKPPQQKIENVAAPQDAPAPQKRSSGETSSDSFEAAAPSRESLQKGFVTQQRLAMAEMREELKLESKEQKDQLMETRSEIRDIYNQVQQMVETFNEQARVNDDNYNTYREELARLAEDARRQQSRQTGARAIGSVEEGKSKAQTRATRRKRISQTPLSGGGNGVRVNPNQALLNVEGSKVREIVGEDGEVIDYELEEPAPFIPPLGFVKGTMLNGVDALAGGGQATPSLVRLSGVYKTAMNSTVDLSGCFALVEFEGDISTERAVGKPSRMTCVYPDQGAVTYELTGYVVDAEDGVIGVPGVFYEGDASRLAAAMVAEFTAGIASVVRENQNTNTVSDEGTESSTITGSAVRSEFAGGVEAATSRLSEYLFERANRIVPFIRLDATRDIHVVLLSGTELRREGGAWTLLFDGVEADKAREKLEKARKQQAEKRAKENKRATR